LEEKGVFGDTDCWEDKSAIPPPPVDRPFLLPHSVKSSDVGAGIKENITELHSSSTFPPTGLTPRTLAVFFIFLGHVGYNFGIVC